MPAAVITSRKNPLIQDLRALLQSPTRRTARCVIEGWRALEAAAAGGADVQLALFTPDAAADAHGAAVRERLESAGVRLVLVSSYVFASLSLVESPQGVLGIARRPREADPSVLGDPHALIVVLDGVQDPGNVGTILRTASAVGTTAAVIVGATADPHGPKAIRASAGAVFRVPWLYFKTAPQAREVLTARSVRILVADPRGDRVDSEVSFARPVALVFGGEGAGSDPAWRGAAGSVRLPMRGSTESLNVAAAAAVLLYKAAQFSAPARP